ncbi:MAG: Ig-like domain-containing protein [Miltoncostaeaceae bacterium]
MARGPRPRAWAALAAGAALLAGASGAAAVDAPGNVASAPASPSNQQSAWTFSWNAVTPDGGNTIVRYEGGLTASAAGTPTTDFGLDLTEPIAPSEGAQFFRVRAVQDIAGPGPYATIPITADFTNPTVGWVVSPPAPNGANGWYTSDVTISPSCSDALSGLLAGSCTGGGTISSESPNPQGFTDGAAADNAGNSVSGQASPAVSLDKSGPGVGFPWIFAPPKPASGWYTTDVTITPTCVDSQSGIASCTGGTTTGEGAGLAVDGSGVNNAGLGTGPVSSSTSGEFGTANVDKTGPSKSVPQTPSNNGVTNDTTPTLVWDPASDALSGLARYEVTLDGVTTNVSALNEEFTPATPLTNGAHTWRVDTVDVAGNTTTGTFRSFTVDPNAVSGPTITAGPANPTNQTLHTIRWAGLPGAVFSWEVRQGNTMVASNPSTTATSLTVSAGGNATYTFVIKQKTTGVFGTETAYTFRVDTVAPAQPVLVGLPPDSSTDATPTFTWVGEPLGLYRWQILSGGNVVQQGDSLANQITPQPLAPGTYLFRVRQTDDAGNVGPFSPQDGFSVVAPAGPAPAPATTTTKTTTKTTTNPVPAVANARRLKPKVGAILTTKRPTLRWNRRAGATVYNVQIFELNGRSFKKVISRFPVRNTFRVPAGKLKFGKRYVWRVWPFLGSARAAASNPVGVSYFDVRRPKLSAVLAKRLLTPRASRFRKATKLNVRWKNRRGSRFYRVELRRNKKVVVRNGKRVVVQRAKRMYRTTSTRRRVIIPAKHLRVKGSYTIAVQASRGKLRNKYHRVTWARTVIRRI